MPQADETRDEALKRLDEQLKTFDAQRAARNTRRLDGERGANEGYRLLAELLGGILGGLGFGWLFDRVAHTDPWGLIGGLAIGFGAAVYMVVRAAGRMDAQAKAAGDAAATAPEDDAGDEDSPGIFGPTEGD